MNYSDSERIETYLQALGFENAKDEKDTEMMIFNSCSVKQRAEDKVIGQIRKARKLLGKNLIVVLTGCMIRKSSSRYSDDRDKLFNRIRELDISLRIEELPKLATLIRELDPKLAIKEIPEEKIENYFSITPRYASKIQPLVAISTGCDKFCTYCIVPFSRGREKSRPIKKVVAEATKLVENGAKEITLIGQTVDSYGLSNYDRLHKTFVNVPEDEVPFVYLLSKIDKLSKKGLRRLRFTSPHPRDISDDLIDAIAELKTLMPYLHLPVQAGHNETLKRMNRPYTIEQYKEIIKKLRKKTPRIAISTDIIVGFCGETEEEFKTTYDFYEEVGFDHAYISRYSERKGTYAQKNLDDDVSLEIKAERWHRLNNLLKKISKEKLREYVSKEVEVLVEKCEKGICDGRSEHFKTVQFPGEKALIGELVKVKITDSKDWVLIGEQA